MLPASLTAQFDAAMDRLGPFEPRPRLAAAVSGGADSTALALLAAGWVQSRHGTLLALIVDHHLRPESTIEAQDAAKQLTAWGIPARILTLTDLPRGPAMAERAREARFAALSAACVEAGILHLLLGHHAGDQAETLVIRFLGGSQPDGMAGMAGLAERASLRLLRPLLGIAPDRLRAALTEARVSWAEDPSNRDMRALRPQVRRLLGTQLPSLIAGASQRLGEARAAHHRATAAWLAEYVAIHPEGYAVLRADQAPPDALAALVQTIGGAAFPPATRAIERLAARLAPATLHSTRLMPAGRLGEGWLLAREASAMAPRVPARPGATWDGRFRIGSAALLPAEATLGPLGNAAALMRRRSSLPSAVLQTLPALWQGDALLAVPHLHYPELDQCRRMPVVFHPPKPASATFVCHAPG